MPKVVSIIPKSKDKDTGAHSVQGTQVLLDDGKKLEGVCKVTLVAEAGAIWKAIIEVYPTNQKQIDALVSDVKVVKHESTMP